MLSIGIKNSILFILIILICHFWIKKVLLTRKEPFVNISQANIDKYIKNETSIVQPKAEIECKAEPLPELSTDDKNVFNSWFGEDRKESDAALEAFFKPDMDVKEEARQAAKCKEFQKDMSYPVSTTCDPGLDKVDNAHMKLKANCGLVQDKKHVMLLNEYDDENSMSGGDLFMNLSAYDNEKLNFASLEETI